MNKKALTKVLSPAQAKAQYSRAGQRNGKPHFTTPTKQVLSFSDEFRAKLLSSGPILNLGFACAFRCAFCYVESLMGRHSVVLRIRKQTGLNFKNFSLTRANPLPVLESELLYRDQSPRYTEPGIVFTSSLIDPCANTEILQTTLQACLLILKHTPWEIRVLTKSALITSLAQGLAAHKDRVLFGLSTGTLDDRVARQVEAGASSPTARIMALEWLHQNGFQTFGMICPILPQADYDRCADQVRTRILPLVSENVWGEVINARGESFDETIAALGAAGATNSQAAMQNVHNHKPAWEQYARRTFEALAAVVPVEKYRFLQYVQPGHTNWWRQQTSRGAVLLGKNA